VPYYGGEFYYFDSNGIKRVNSFWLVTTSIFAQSTLGSLSMITLMFIRDILTLITTLILNIVSLFEMNKYFNNRSLLLGRHNAIAPVPVASINNSTRILDDQNEAQNAKKKNHIELMLIMCLISIAERTSTVLVNVYSLFSVDYIAFLLGTFQDLVFVLGPSVSFFVFYHFNADFKRECLTMLKKFVSKI